MRQYLVVEVEIGKDEEYPGIQDWGQYKHMVSKIRRWEASGIKVHGVLELTQNGIERRMSPA